MKFFLKKLKLYWKEIIFIIVCCYVLHKPERLLQIALVVVAVEYIALQTFYSVKRQILNSKEMQDVFSGADGKLSINEGMGRTIFLSMIFLGIHILIGTLGSTIAFIFYDNLLKGF